MNGGRDGDEEARIDRRRLLAGAAAGAGAVATGVLALAPPRLAAPLASLTADPVGEFRSVCVALCGVDVDRRTAAAHLAAVDQDHATRAALARLTRWATDRRPATSWPLDPAPRALGQDLALRLFTGTDGAEPVGVDAVRVSPGGAALVALGYGAASGCGSAFGGWSDPPAGPDRPARA